MGRNKFIRVSSAVCRLVKSVLMIQLSVMCHWSRSALGNGLAWSHIRKNVNNKRHGCLHSWNFYHYIRSGPSTSQMVTSDQQDGGSCWNKCRLHRKTMSFLVWKGAGGVSFNITIKPKVQRRRGGGGDLSDQPDERWDTDERPCCIWCP